MKDHDLGANEPPAGDELVVWQSTFRLRDIGYAILTAGLFVAFNLGVHALVPSDWEYSWLEFVVVPLSIVAGLITAKRGRVTLRSEGIEIRKVRTRFYRWASIRSMELDDEDHLRITPDGWLRHVPVPRSQRPEVLALMQQWRARAVSDTSTSGEVEV